MVVGAAGSAVAVAAVAALAGLHRTHLPVLSASTAGTLERRLSSLVLSPLPGEMLLLALRVHVCVSPDFSSEHGGPTCLFSSSTGMEANVMLFGDVFFPVVNVLSVECFQIPLVQILPKEERLRHSLHVVETPFKPSLGVAAVNRLLSPPLPPFAFRPSPVLSRKGIRRRP